MRLGIFQFFVWGLRSREPQKKCGRNVAFFVWEEPFGKNPEEWQKRQDPVLLNSKRRNQGKKMGWMTRFELATSWATTRRSNQLSYNHHEKQVTNIPRFTGISSSLRVNIEKLPWKIQNENEGLAQRIRMKKSPGTLCFPRGFTSNENGKIIFRSTSCTSSRNRRGKDRFCRLSEHPA